MVKRKADRIPTEKSKMDVDGDDDSSDNESMIDVDFEFFGLNSEVDFHGLKTLMKQLFDVDNDLLELSQLVDLILAQADAIGTAVKCDGEESDPYSFITVLQVRQHQEKDEVKQLLAYLKSRLDTNVQMTDALSNSNINLGIVLSERLINMPHQVVPPMYNMLQREISLGGAEFAFTHLLFISRTYTEVESILDAQSDRPHKKAKASKSAELFYFHPEDEVFKRHAITEQSFQYQKENDAANSDSRRAFQEAGFKPQGYALLLDASKLNTTIQDMTKYFETG